MNACYEGVPGRYMYVNVGVLIMLVGVDVRACVVQLYVFRFK